MGFGGEYHIHLYRDDETISLVMVLHAGADMDAKSEAKRMLKDGLVRADIWRNDVKVAAVDLQTGPPSTASGAGSLADSFLTTRPVSRRGERFLR
jgi:hypothetical protein